MLWYNSPAKLVGENMQDQLDELRSLGLFLKADFLDRDLCATLRQAGAAQCIEPASILVNGNAAVDSRIRHAETADIRDRGLDAEIRCHLESIMPAISKQYGTDLAHYEDPQIIRYQPGGFYRPHIDDDERTGMVRRKVSCVVFLNTSGRSAGDGVFTGGALSFFRLPSNVTEENCRTLLYPTTGLLVAFKSSVYHEVLPVLEGERFTLVTWFS